MNLFELERERPPILGFFGEYRFLSNFHLCTCLVNDIPFNSSEHAYMYQKSFDPVYQQSIINAEKPSDAKRLGANVKLRSDWGYYRKTSMLIALQAKFRNPVERELLLSTGDAYLEETNQWHDTYWGVCNGVGENNLGKMLMTIRSTCYN